VYARVRDIAGKLSASIICGRAGDAGSQINDSGGVAGIDDAEGDGVFHPVVPDSIRIVRGGRDGVFLRAEIAGEGERDGPVVARGGGAKLDVFQFCVCAVDFEPDTRTDHDSHDGIFDGCQKGDGDADLRQLSGSPGRSWFAGRIQGFERYEPGPAITAVQRGRKGKLMTLSGCSKNFRRIAAPQLAGSGDPPSFVAHSRIDSPDEERFAFSLAA
jgi:hypothetical protein